MFFSSKTNRFVYDTLSRGPATITELVKSCNLAVTDEAIYLAIRNMIKDGIVIKTGKRIMLNLLSLQSLAQEIALIHKNYYDSGQAFLDMLQGKEPITYRLNTFIDLENFWDHLWIELIPQENSIPSVWLQVDAVPYWPSLFPQNAAVFLDGLCAKNYIPCLAFDSAATFPKGVLAHIRAHGAQVAFKSRIKTNVSYVVFGDIVTEIFFPTAQYQRIQEYMKNKTIDLEKLRAMVEKMGPFRIKLSRNKEKADAILAKYKQVFVYPKK